MPKVVNVDMKFSSPRCELTRVMIKGGGSLFNG
jgi:uncharacterized Fe-S cluster protein YjdI